MELRVNDTERAPQREGSLRGWLLATGLALAGLGVLAIVLPSFSTLAVGVIVGWLLVVGGVVHGVHAFRADRGAWPRDVVAALYVIAGIFILLRPIAGALALTVVLSAFLVAVGVSRVLVARHLRHTPGWGWTLGSGILSILLGGMLLAGWPSTAFWALGLYVGVDLLFAGWSLIGLALLARAPAARLPR